VEIEFLTLDELINIHLDQIERYGGALGIRDWGLLQSANAMPAAAFGGQYVHADVFEMAAAYLSHIVQNHPLIDGNIRVGAVAADVFLTLNGQNLIAGQGEYANLVRSVASSETSKSAIAEFFRANTKPA
jgi:death-on-curing protein